MWVCGLKGVFEIRFVRELWEDSIKNLYVVVVGSMYIYGDW